MREVKLFVMLAAIFFGSMLLQAWAFGADTELQQLQWKEFELMTPIRVLDSEVTINEYESQAPADERYVVRGADYCVFALPAGCWVVRSGDRLALVRVVDSGAPDDDPGRSSLAARPPVKITQPAKTPPSQSDQKRVVRVYVQDECEPCDTWRRSGAPEKLQAMGLEVRYVYPPHNQRTPSFQVCDGDRCSPMIVGSEVTAEQLARALL